MKKLCLLILLLLFFSCSSKSEDENSISLNPPSRLTINDISPSSATISWIANEESISYQIEYGLDGFNQGEGEIVSTTHTSHQINNLSEETNYQYYLRSNYGNEQYSNWVGPNSFLTTAYPCVPPNEISTIQNNNISFTINWSAVGASTAYEIKYGLSRLLLEDGESITSDTNSITLSDLEPESDYEFYIRTICEDDISSDWSAVKNFSTTLSGCTVTNLTSVVLDDNEVYLNWGIAWNTGSYATNWEIEYGPIGFVRGTGTSIITENTDRIGYIFDNLTASTGYDAYVRARCNTGDIGPFVGPTTFTTLAVCAPPIYVQSIGSSQCSISVSWNPNSESNWDIEYGITGFTLGEGTIINTSNRPVTIDGLISNSTYDIYVRANCGADVYSEHIGPVTETTDNIGYVGEYQYESIIDGKDGPVFGAPHIVTLNKISDTEREMNVTYAESLGQGNLPFNFKFGLNCDGKIVVNPNQDTALICGSNIVQIGPISSYNLPTYDRSQDDELIITFTEYSNFQALDCPDDYSFEVSIKLTKQ